MTANILVVNDLHINSTTALAHPRAALDDGGDHGHSKLQKALWERWCDLVSKAEQVAKTGPLLLVLNGDIVEGDAKDRSTQLISRNRADILGHAAEVLEPLLRLAATTLLFRGTAAHVGKSAELEELLGKDIGAMQDPVTNKYSRWIGNVNVNGVRLNIAHHASMGRMPWTTGQAGINLASRILFERTRRNRELPHLVLRGHMHRWADSFQTYPQIRAVFVPGWQGPTEYIYRVDPDSLPEVGALFIHLPKPGKYALTKIDYQIVESTWEPIILQP